MATTTTYTPAATLKALSDPDKPVFATHGDQLADNHKSSREWIGKSYAPTDDHDHDGVNSKTVTIGANAVNEAAIQASAVSAGKLKAASNEVSTAFGANLAFVSSFYHFYPMVKVSSGNLSAAILSAFAVGSSYVSYIHLVPSLGTGYANAYYVQTSPPHHLGKLPDWGEFVFLHRKKSDGVIISSWCAPDPVWAGQWSHLPKNHPGRVAQMPHPFVDLYGKPLPDGEEIVLVDLRSLSDLRSHRPALAALQAMKADRARLRAMGIADEELDLYEALQQGQADDEKPRKLLRVDILKHTYEAAGKSFLQAINEGLIPEAIAEHELPQGERALLPQAPAFKNIVRVLQKR